MSTSPSPWSVRARWVFPGDGPPLSHGVVTILGDSILAVGEKAEYGLPEDLGDVAILPGLVNAHTHLEFSQLAQPLGQPGMRFADWIGCLVAYRRNQQQQTPQPPQARQGSDPVADRRAAIRQGVDESLAHGVTTLGEIATAPWDLSSYEPAIVQGTLFYELLGLDPDRAAGLLSDAVRHLDARPGGGWEVGLSPHAPYTVHPDLLREVVQLSARRRAPLAMHLAETLEELELLASHSGPLVERLMALDAWHPRAIPRGIGLHDYLRMLAEAERVLVIHGNYLGVRDFALLAGAVDRMSVVYCPRTHAYFGHGTYPLAEMLAAGVRVALGTDSRASNPDLSLLEELRFVARRHAGIAPEQVLRMGTLSGAEALGLASRVGSLCPGKQADLAMIDLTDGASGDPWQWLLNSSQKVFQVVKSGRRPLGNPLDIAPHRQAD